METTRTRTICVSQIPTTKSTWSRHTLRNSACTVRYEYNENVLLVNFDSIYCNKFCFMFLFSDKMSLSVSVIAWKCSFKIVGFLADLTVHFETPTNRLVRFFIGLNASISTMETWLLGLWPPVAHISYKKNQFFIISSKWEHFFRIKVIHFQKVDA